MVSTLLQGLPGDRMVAVEVPQQMRNTSLHLTP